MAKTGAVYFVLKNKGAEPDRLVSVSATVAESAQLHANTMRDGMVHMEPVAGIDIPASGSAELKPGGFHVMLMGPKRQLKPGQHFEMTLTFAKAGQVTIQVPVKRQAGTDGMGMDHGKMGHGDMKDDMGGMKH
jgi:copper(I)-binding protein